MRSRRRCVAGLASPVFAILHSDSSSSFSIIALASELLKQPGRPGCHSIGSGPVPAKTMSEPGLDVAACVELVRQKDEEAARQLVEHLYPVVFKLVRAYLPPRSSERPGTSCFYESVCQSGPVFEFASAGTLGGADCHQHLPEPNPGRKIRPELRRADLSEAQCQVLDTLGAVSEELPPDQALAARNWWRNCWPCWNRPSGSC